MPDEGGEKTEQPTPRRRQEARDAGQIARSPDLSAAVLLLGILILLKSFGEPIVSALKLVVIEMLDAPSLANLDGGNMGSQIARCAAAVGAAMTPMLIGIML